MLDLREPWKGGNEGGRAFNMKGVREEERRGGEV